VGSYWAHTSTLWDYIHRAMPFTQPESLSDDEVYAITAYVLHLNDIVDYDFVLTQDNLTEIRSCRTRATSSPRSARIRTTSAA
jgi:cytochrome c